jgi:hypothetical protein
MYFRALACFAMVVVSATTVSADEADEIVTKLAKKLNLVIEHKDSNRNGPIERLTIANRKVTKQENADFQILLKQIPNLKHLKVLSFLGTRVGNTVMKQVGALPSLDYLDLGATIVTDEGMKDLAGLPKLRVLGLGQTKVGDEGLKEIAKIQSLSSLGLAGTPVTDKGIASLLALKKLETLDVAATTLTDASLTTFAQMPSLKSVRGSAYFTPQGIDTLKKQRPTLAVGLAIRNK